MNHCEFTSQSFVPGMICPQVVLIGERRDLRVLVAGCDLDAASLAQIR